MAKSERQIIEQARRNRDALDQPETLERIIKAVQAELGPDFLSPDVTYGMINAAGYHEQKNLGGIFSDAKDFIFDEFLAGAKAHGCQCKKCTAKREAAKASTDDVLRKAARNG